MGGNSCVIGGKKMREGSIGTEKAVTVKDAREA